MDINFVTFYDIQKMYMEVITKELKFLDYEFPYYRVEVIHDTNVVTKKSILIKDIVVTNGFITTKNSGHTTNNLIEFLCNSINGCVCFNKKDLEDFISCIFYNAELKKFKIEEFEYTELQQLDKLDEYYIEILGSKVVSICQNLQLLYPNLKDLLINVRNGMLERIPFSEREFNVGGHNNIIIGD